MCAEPNILTAGNMRVKLNIDDAPSRALGQKKAGVEVTAEQIKYANLLLYGSWAGMVILAVTFIMYAAGIMTSSVAPADMHLYWGMKASAYVEATRAPQGWGWLGMIRYGDYLPLVGIAFLGSLTVIGYLILLPAYFIKKDKIYSAITFMELLMLFFAASGILKSGGH